jgi:uncharacterized membrane protein
VVAIGAIAGLVFLPGAKRLKAISERDVAAAGGGPVTVSEEYNKRARLGAIFGAISGLLLVVAVFLMTTKPGV